MGMPLPPLRVPVNMPLLTLVCAIVSLLSGTQRRSTMSVIQLKSKVSNSTSRLG
ncbi:hypothetical protein ARMSODRAFT_966306 [Armillaria solidipes]|uniref:Uncharacterized protein n=1 Tax=Armillaria solidipes TaxID=1076256 RepID=A0A2H3B6B6_9AGAR|nr:hypothetical protein ARMSODRAFT_966306 [Armillaria solidipes]